MTPATIDVVTIFPEYFTPLDLSLIGKARAQGIIDISVHDLREWAEGSHRSVDDTPAGGGAGMVMRPDVWGRALDQVLTPHGVLVIPTPGGKLFAQHHAQRLAQQLHEGHQLVFACGRYEGIDARVGQHYASMFPVEEFSIGDYVLNGGESAALAMIEAITRLVPGVVGNPESLVEESHSYDGLLEYPVYTSPHTWRGLEVPAILKSGDHRAIHAWRQAQSLSRTAKVRPDLVDPHPVKVRAGKAADAQRLYEVAQATFPLACPPGFDHARAQHFVEENLNPMVFRRWAKERSTSLWVAQINDVIVAYAVVEHDRDNHTGLLSKFYVLAEHHGTKVANTLMEHLVSQAKQAGMTLLQLGVNRTNVRAQRFYERYGFRVIGEREFNVGGVIHNDFVMERTLSFVSGV